MQLADAAAPWASLRHDDKVDRLDLADADHTFSRQDWLQTVEQATLDWVRLLDNAGEPSSRTVDSSLRDAASTHHR